MNSPARLAPTAVACLALACAGVGTAQADAGSPEPANRAPIKPWVALSGDLTLNQSPDLLRVGSRLQVVWPQTDTDGDRSVRTRILDAAGKPASPIRPVVVDWLAVTNHPQLVRHQGLRLAVFAGIGPTGFTGHAVHATSDNGLDWTLQDGALSETSAAQSATTGIAVTDAAGEPLFAMGDFGAAILHRGINVGGDTTADFEAADSSATYVEVATDRVSGQSYVAWFNLSPDTPADAGTFAQKMWPRPNGALQRGPASANAAGQALNPGQGVAMAARAGGGVYVAYRQGYPTSRTIRIWKVGTRSAWTVRSQQTVDSLALASGPAGRLWLSWRTVGDGRLHAARTNKAATRIGAVRALATPGRGTGQYWSTAIEGSRGPLDVVVNAQANGGSPRLYSAHVLPGLSLKVTPKRLNKGRINVRVTDAGDAVRQATVRFNGKSARTDKQGRASFRVGARVADGRYRVAVGKPGYAGVAGTVRVT
jgi:hypothetical protein